ncbi:MAG: Crp/Fnr family transcriptional regulator [Bacteroidetes bacterium 4572_77]|nr:MAG: Crp/Fnr family transcriptional regulator [Bacteroidetes bacterium 4572_77]
MDKTTKALSQLPLALQKEIQEHSQLVSLPRNTEILTQGQYVKVVPLVIGGLIKVFTRSQDKELLLYYIRPEESCIMSFSAAIKNEKSHVFASTSENTTALLLPTDKLIMWTKEYTELNTLFFSLYKMRYDDLVDTIEQIVFHKLDYRLYEYLKEKILITQLNPIKISHREIANELGTAREVISRALKKLENEGKLKQHQASIEVF